MCFSPTASFSTSFLLLVLSKLAHKKMPNQSYRFCARMPAFFAAQQALEGIVWLSFLYPALAVLRLPASYGFIFFAFAFWPVYIPFSLHAIEIDPVRKKILFGLQRLGTGLSFFLYSYTLLLGVSMSAVQNHISYSVPLSLFVQNSAVVLYVCVVVLPFFITSARRFWIFGLGLAISYALSYYLYLTAFISVWCFFAALLSGLLVLLLARSGA